MNKTKYSKEIASAVNSFLSKDEWNFSFDNDNGIFRFVMILSSKLKRINCMVRVSDDSYTVYAISPIGADEDDATMMTNMAEFVCRANYGLETGNFEFDFNDGEIRYKVNVCCRNIAPSAEIIRNSIYCPIVMFRRYGDGITDVIFNGTSGKTAVEKCEQVSEKEYLRALAALMSEDDSDKEMLLTELLEKYESDTDIESISVSADESDIHTELFEKKGAANL